MARKNFYSFRNEAGADNKPAVLDIFDEIGFWGANAADFSNKLKGITASEIEVQINSPGGSVFDGIAIYNMLRGVSASGKKITMKVMGVAASIASVILLAGDKIVMPSNSMVMVHSPSGGVFGTADEMRALADVLDKVKTSLVATYVTRTGLSEAEVLDMLSTDTWLTAAEAKDKGFADEVIDPVELTASFDITDEALPEAARVAFKAAADARAVTALKAQADADAVEAARIAAEAAAAAHRETWAAQVQAFAASSGFEAHAASWAVKYTKPDEIAARIEECREIKALYVLAKRADKVDTVIAAGTSLAAARTELQNAMAADDKHIDTAPKTPGADQGAALVKALNPTSVYAKRAGRTTENSNQPTNPGPSAVSTAAIWAKRNK